MSQNIEGEGKHFLFLGGFLWGHLRPAQAFILRLLDLHPTLRVTFVMSGIVAHKAATDKLRYHLTPDIQSRFRAIHVLQEPKDGAALTSTEEYALVLQSQNSHLNEIYTKILKGESISDTATGMPVHAFPQPPVLVFCDITLWAGVTAVEQVTAELGVTKPKFCCFAPLSTNSMHCLESEVFQDMVHKICASENREEAYQKYFASNDTLVQHPNLNPFYAYELDPNQPSWYIFDVWKAFSTMPPRWDYMINAWPACFDRESAQFFQDMIKEEHFSIGPQLPPDYHTRSRESGEFSVEDESGNVDDFLDKQLEENGERSVLYISFGSLEYPPSEEQIRIVLSTLNEINTPYILARGSPPDPIGAILPSLVQESGGRGLLGTWVKQFAVLQHPAILGFMTHGGSSSAMESIICGVPMIQWPALWDQPEIANELDFRGVAHELIQFRKGHNIGKPTGRGTKVVGTPEAMRTELIEVIELLRGPKGDLMREKARSLGKEIEADQAEGGRSFEMLMKIGTLG